jgi:hypothetical protein
VLALDKPAADAVMVAVPALEAVKVDDAVPRVGEMGESGLNVPATPVTAKVIGVVAVVTVLPPPS